MRRSVTLILFALACRGSDAAPGNGRLEIDSEPGGRLVRTSARGLACARDTTAAVVGIGSDWSAAISLRTLLPAGEREFRIRGRLDSSGVAMVALRALGDTMITVIADSGTVRLIGGDSLAGTFEAHAGPDSTLRRLTGRFAVALPADSCP